MANTQSSIVSIDGVLWQLVPAEPTRSMMARAVMSAEGDAVYKSVEARFLEAEERKYGEAYTAMLAAAPRPPAAQEGKPLARYQRDSIKAGAFRETTGNAHYDADAIITATEAAHGITPQTGD